MAQLQLHEHQKAILARLSGTTDTANAKMPVKAASDDGTDFVEIFTRILNKSARSKFKIEESADRTVTVTFRRGFAYGATPFQLNLLRRLLEKAGKEMPLPLLVWSATNKGELVLRLVPGEE